MHRSHRSRIAGDQQDIAGIVLDGLGSSSGWLAKRVKEQRFQRRFSALG